MGVIRAGLKSTGPRLLWHVFFLTFSQALRRPGDLLNGVTGLLNPETGLLNSHIVLFLEETRFIKPGNLVY